MTTLAPGRRGMLGLLALPFLACAARAAPALNRPVRIIVGGPPGSGTDLCARLLAEGLRDRYALQVVVENRPGNDARTAAEEVKAAAPDGATMLVAPMPVMTLFPHVFPRTVRYDALADFAPVTTLGAVPYGWVVRPDHPARTLPTFLDWAGEKGGATFAPPFAGAPQHIIGLQIARLAGVTLTPAFYRSAAAAQQDLVAGRIDCVFSRIDDLADLLNRRQTRLIGVSTAERMRTRPEAPPFNWAPFSGLAPEEATCLYLPAGVPAALSAALHRATDEAIGTPAMLRGLVQKEFVPMVTSQAAMVDRIRAERRVWGWLVDASGYTPNG